LLHREGEIQRLAAEAAAEASRVKALQALALDPHVSSPKAAEELLDAFLEEHAGFVSPELGPSPDSTGRQQEIPREEDEDELLRTEARGAHCCAL
jgi:hypothetical protein